MIGDNLIKAWVTDKKTIDNALELQKILREWLKNCFIDTNIPELENKYWPCVTKLIEDFGKKISEVLWSTSFMMWEVVSAMVNSDLTEYVLKSHKTLINSKILHTLDKLLNWLISENQINVNLELSDIIYDENISKTSTAINWNEQLCFTNIIKWNFVILCWEWNKVSLPIPFEFDTSTKDVIIFDTNSNKQMMLRIIKNKILTSNQ